MIYVIKAFYIRIEQVGYQQIFLNKVYVFNLALIVMFSQNFYYSEIQGHNF